MRKRNRIKFWEGIFMAVGAVIIALAFFWVGLKVPEPVEIRYVHTSEIEYIDKEVEVIVEKNTWWWQYEATGYSANDPEQGTNDVMASGKNVYVGAVAMDDSVPFGTQIWIIENVDQETGIYDELGVFTVEDRGSAIGRGQVDIYFSTKLEAQAFGRKTVWICFGKPDANY